MYQQTQENNCTELDVSFYELSSAISSIEKHKFQLDVIGNIVLKDAINKLNDILNSSELLSL